ILVALGHGVPPLALRGGQHVPAVVTPRLRHVPTAETRSHRAQGLSRLAAPSRPPLQRRVASLTAASTVAHFRVSGMIFPIPLPALSTAFGNGNWEAHGTPVCAAIKCCDRNAIKQRDPAYPTAPAASVSVGQGEHALVAADT